MTWGVGCISQWPILLLQGLEMTGKKYDLHLHVDATTEKLSMNCCEETKRSVEKKKTSETHMVLDRRKMMNTAAASSSRGVAAATTGTSSEREDFFLSFFSWQQGSQWDSTHQSPFSQMWCVWRHNQPIGGENTRCWASGGRTCAAIGQATKTRLEKNRTKSDFLEWKHTLVANVFFFFHLLWHISSKTDSNLPCISEPLLSITRYPFTPTGLDFLFQTQLTVTVVLVTPVTFIWTASITADKHKPVFNC